MTAAGVCAAVAICAAGFPRWRQRVQRRLLLHKLLSRLRTSTQPNRRDVTPCLASRKHTPKVAITTLAVGVLSNIYNYDYGIVLFNPTLTFGEQIFRLDKEGAAAYFIGGNRKYHS